MIGWLFRVNILNQKTSGMQWKMDEGLKAPFWSYSTFLSDEKLITNQYVEHEY